MPKGPQPGDQAPDFQLEGTDGSFKLSDNLGKRVVLLFYPGDDTPVCTKQFCSYRDAGEDMSSLEAVVVGISPQGLDSHANFIAKHSLNVPLLADTGKTAAKLYGMTGLLPPGTKRGVVIVDEQGKVAFRHDHLIGLDFLTVDQLKAALAGVRA
ncbi:MAG: peroxiredoxin [Actinomycetes bacterium]